MIIIHLPARARVTMIEHEEVVIKGVLGLLYRPLQSPDDAPAGRLAGGPGLKKQTKTHTHNQTHLVYEQPDAMKHSLVISVVISVWKLS